MLRDPCQVQIAHDAVARALTTVAMTQLERSYWLAVGDALCWVLQHDHNRDLEDNLRKLMIEMNQTQHHCTGLSGFEMARPTKKES